MPGILPTGRLRRMKWRMTEPGQGKTGEAPSCTPLPDRESHRSSRRVSPRHSTDLTLATPEHQQAPARKPFFPITNPLPLITSYQAPTFSPHPCCFAVFSATCKSFQAPLSYLARREISHGSSCAPAGLPKKRAIRVWFIRCPYPAFSSDALEHGRIPMPVGAGRSPHSPLLRNSARSKLPSGLGGPNRNGNLTNL